VRRRRPGGGCLVGRGSSHSRKCYHKSRSEGSRSGGAAMERPVDAATLCAHAREKAVPGPPPLSTPIYQTAVWRLESLEQVETLNTAAEPGYIYTRDGNPNHTALEELVAALEGAPAALVTASGMGAIAVALLGLAQAGDHVVAGDTLYGATTRL